MWKACADDDGKFLQNFDPGKTGTICGIRNHSGDTLIHAASKYGSEAALRTLLSIPGVDGDAQNGQGATALHVAAYHGHAGCVKVLLNYVASKKHDKGMHLAKAPAEDASRSLTTSTIPAPTNSCGLIPFISGATALHLAAHAVCSTSTKALAELLAYGTDIGATDHMGRTVIHYLLSTPSQLLNAPPSRTLGFAAYDYLSLKMEYDSDISEEKRQISAENLERGILLLCDALGGSETMDAADCHGATALHLAAAQGHVGCIRALLETAADPGRSDKFNRTPLDVAIARDSYSLGIVAHTDEDTSVQGIANGVSRTATVVALLRQYGAPTNNPAGSANDSSSTPQRASMSDRFTPSSLQAHVRAAVSHSPSNSSVAGSLEISPNYSGGRRSPRDSSPHGSGPSSSAISSVARFNATTPPDFSQMTLTGRSNEDATKTFFESSINPKNHRNESPVDRRRLSPSNNRGMLKLSPAARAAIDENSLGGKLIIRRFVGKKESVELCGLDRKKGRMLNEISKN